ncbi:integrase [Curtobacterium sp. NPDC090217]|uniref:integrase n=1 Tax=Curtobacterium sp. NPDC090217 TaxID=3363970 RepID=UPI0037F2E0DF
MLSLRELHSAITWAGQKVLSPATATWLARDVEADVGRDRGLGDRELRKQLTAGLRAKPTSGNHAHRSLARLTDLVDETYLLRWADAARSDQTPSIERMSRAIATHLLDAGYHIDFLHDWVSALGDADPATVAEAAHALASEPEYSWSVFVPFVAIPAMDGNRDSAPGWISPGKVAGWLAASNVESTVRHNGGFLYEVSAHDPHGAVESVSEIVDRMTARARYSRKRVELEPAGVAIVAEHGELPLRTRRRHACVLSLLAEKRLYDVGSNSLLDAALELAAPLNDGPAGPAISGAWAAIESLLLSSVDESEEGRGVLAADRMAALITCSWPRAELTALSYKHRADPADRLAVQLRNAELNRDRARAVAAAMRRDSTLSLRRGRDKAAEHRLLELVHRPRLTLREIETHMQRATRRLYRHRNLLMHGGAVDVVSLPMTLRTVAPLLGAGLDRVTHAHLTTALAPLDLAARARTSIDLAGSPDGRDLADLLE